MGSTTRSDIGTLLNGAGRSSTHNLDNAISKQFSRQVALSATATDQALFVSDGSSDILSIRFIPDTAIASHGTDLWTISVKNEGTDGTGTAAVGTTFTTNGSALVAHVPKSLYAPTRRGTTRLTNGQVLSFTATKGGAAANLNGLFIVKYITHLG